MPAKTTAKKKVAAKASKGKGFSDEEKSAMRERIKELQSTGDGETAVREKIATFEGTDRVMAERIHAIVMANAPGLQPRLYYGMPAYEKDGATLCYFQDARKFKSRYATFGFNQGAHLDDGNVWPIAWAIQKLTPADEAKIAALVRQAVS